MKPHYVRESEPHWSDVQAEVDESVIRGGNWTKRPDLRKYPELVAKVVANDWIRQKQASKRKGCWRPSRENKSLQTP